MGKILTKVSWQLFSVGPQMRNGSKYVKPQMRIRPKYNEIYVPRGLMYVEFRSFISYRDENDDHLGTFLNFFSSIKYISF
jgi:hypothetical protein